MEYKVQPPEVYESTERFENAELEARRLALRIKGHGHPFVTDCEIELESEGEDQIIWHASISLSGHGVPEDLPVDLEQRLQWLLQSIRKS